MTRTDFSLLNDKLRYESWSEVLSCDDVSLSFDLFVNKFNGSVDSCSSVVRVPSSRRRLKPWISDALVASIRWKNSLRKRANKHPNDTRLQRRTKIASKKVDMDIRNAKARYYCDKFKHAERNGRLQWCLINELLGRAGTWGRTS